MSVSLPPQATSTTSASSSDNASSKLESQSTPAPTSATELARAKASLKLQMRLYPDFPIPGVGFVDIMPLFADHNYHSSLIQALELQVLEFTGGVRPDIIVGLDARGFLFGPSLALRLGAGFVPVRKRGKLPGPTAEASYEKEYGCDHFQMQKNVISSDQSVLIVDDIIATGGSAQAAGNLVEQLGGRVIGYLFILEIEALKGRDKLNAPVCTLLEFGK